MGELIRSFAEFAPVGSTVTFIGQAPPMQCLPKQMGNVSRFEFVKHPYPTSLEVSAVLDCDSHPGQCGQPAPGFLQPLNLSS